MDKKHILLIENDENKIDFFKDALKESKLSFLCSTARSIEQANIILKNMEPDIVFIDVYIVEKAGSIFFKKIKTSQKTPFILYSNIVNQKTEQALNFENLNYVLLPGSIKTMAHILQNLFIN